MSENPIESLATGVESISEKCCVCIEDCEEQIRNEPWISVLIAAAIGYLLCVLPVGRVVGAVLRSLLVLVKPALLVLGVIKLVSCFSVSKTESK